MITYRLHYFPESGNSYKIALMLTLCGQTFEPIWTDFGHGVTRTSEWRSAFNEMGEIPILEEDGQRFTQTAPILLRLAQRYGRFAGRDEQEQFEILRWLFWDNHKLSEGRNRVRFRRQPSRDKRMVAADRSATRLAGSVRWLSEISDHPALIVVTHGIVARVLRGLYAGLERSLALSLPIPQDRVFRLAGGKIEEIEIEVQVGLSMPRFSRVSALDGCRLYVEFDDGLTGAVDVRSLLNSLDESVFGQVVINDFGAVCWPTGDALGPDLIYNCIKGQRVVVG